VKDQLCIQRLDTLHELKARITATIGNSTYRGYFTALVVRGGRSVVGMYGAGCEVFCT
jgi:hypothetical protein